MARRNKKNRKNAPQPLSVNNQENLMAKVTKIDVTFDDGSVQSLSAVPTPTPTDTEVDILLSDGTVKKFIPQS